MLRIVYQCCITFKLINPLRDITIHEQWGQPSYKPSATIFSRLTKESETAFPHICLSFHCRFELGDLMVWWCSHVWIFLFEIQGQTGKATKFIEHPLWAKHCVLSCLDQEGWDPCVVRVQIHAPDMTSHFHSAHSKSLT